MDYFIKNAFDSIKKIGIDLKHCKISNIEAADKICRVLCDVTLFELVAQRRRWRKQLKKSLRSKMQHFILSTTVKDLVFFLRFLTMWFGRNTKIADISPEEFERAFNACMHHVKAKEGIDG